MEWKSLRENPAAAHVWGALLGYYILLSNIYAMDNKWENVTNLRTLIKGKALMKMSGQSVFEVESDIRSFVAGDGLHLDSDQIYVVLGNLDTKMRAEGYVPNVDLLLT
ncbi:hypothetical protein ACFX15_022787 [Malus domestica]